MTYIQIIHDSLQALQNHYNSNYKCNSLYYLPLLQEELWEFLLLGSHEKGRPRTSHNLDPTLNHLQVPWTWWVSNILHSIMIRSCTHSIGQASPRTSPCTKCRHLHRTIPHYGTLSNLLHLFRHWRSANTPQHYSRNFDRSLDGRRGRSMGHTHPYQLQYM